MTRCAILIEASRIRNHGDLPGARADVERFKLYLESDIGGAWNGDEIFVLRHPTRRVLMEHISFAGRCAYAFVTFSGHGHHVRGAEIDETRLCINDSEEVAVSELNSGSDRSLVIADSCRKLTIVEPEETIRAFQFSLNQKLAAISPNRLRCRALFESALQEAERGPIFMYSCGLDESAGESRNGGTFSRALLDAGESWAELRRRGALRTNDAFAIAAGATTRKNRQQNPVSEASRRRVHFPFSVFAA